MKEADYRNLGEAYFAQVLTLVLQRLEEYGITVLFSHDLPDSSVAEFNGPTISLAEKLSPDATLFTLLHLFGHTVDFSLDPNNQLGSEASLTDHRASERKASQYGLTLLHQLGVTELDQWLSDVWHWDWEYIEGVYGRNEPARPSFILSYSQIPYGQSLLKPLPIPLFRLRQFETKTVI